MGVHDWSTNRIKLGDGDELMIFFEPQGPPYDSYEIVFTRGGKFDKVGLGSEIKVFSTVLAVIKEFIERADPRRLVFSAEKETKDDQSRERLYNRLVRKFASQHGYKADLSSSSIGTFYELTRK